MGPMQMVLNGLMQLPWYISAAANDSDEDEDELEEEEEEEEDASESQKSIARARHLPAPQKRSLSSTNSLDVGSLLYTGIWKSQDDVTMYGRRRRPSLAAIKASQRRNSICLIQGGAGKPTRRLSEPFLFHAHNAAQTRSLNRQQLANWKQGYAPRRRLSTTAALMPASSRLKLRAIAKDELLASLNVPLNEEEDQSSISEERDSSDEELLQPTDHLDSDYQAEKDRLEEKRRRVIEEIVHTEQKYIVCLETMETVFKTPMLNQGIASEKDIRTLFPACLSSIRENHVDFLEELEERASRCKTTGTIGDIFEKISGPSKVHLLDLYTDYVNTFPKAISTFGRCSRQSQKFRKFVQESYRHPGCGNLDLPSYLITPVQRLPRYVLLLRQLLKYTKEDHPDNTSIRDALTKMESLICCLNDSIQSSMLAFCSGTAPASGRRGTLSRHISRKKKKRGKDGSQQSLALEKSAAVKRSSSEPVSHVLRGKGRPMVKLHVDSTVDQGYCSLSEKKDGIPEDAVAESNLSLSLDAPPGLLMFPKPKLKRSSSPNIFAPTTAATSLGGSNASLDSADGVTMRRLGGSRNSELRKSWRKSLSTALTSIWSPPPTTKEESPATPTSATATTTASKFTFDEDASATMDKDAVMNDEPCTFEEKTIGSTPSSAPPESRPRSSSSLARRKYGVSYPKSASCGDGLSDFLQRLESDGNEEATTSEANNNTKVVASESFKSKKRGSFMMFRRRRSSRRNSNVCESESDHDERLSSVSSGSPVMPKISDSEVLEVLESSSAPATPAGPLSRRASKSSSTRGSTLSLFFQKARNRTMSKTCSERDLTELSDAKETTEDQAVRKSSTRQRIVNKFKSRSNKNEDRRRSLRQQSTTSLPDLIDQNRRLSFCDITEHRETDERFAKAKVSQNDVTVVKYRRKSKDELMRASSVDNLALGGKADDSSDKARLKRKAFRKSLKSFVSFNKW